MSNYIVIYYHTYWKMILETTKDLINQEKIAKVKLQKWEMYLD